MDRLPPTAHPGLWLLLSKGWWLEIGLSWTNLHQLKREDKVHLPWAGKQAHVTSMCHIAQMVRVTGQGCGGQLVAQGLCVCVCWRDWSTSVQTVQPWLVFAALSESMNNKNTAVYRPLAGPAGHLCAWEVNVRACACVCVRNLLCLRNALNVCV